MKWPTAPLDTLKSPNRYSFVGGPFGSELTTRDYVAEGVPVIRGNNLSGPGKFHDDDYVYVREKKAKALQSNLAAPGDLVFTQRGTLGQIGLIPSNAKFERYVISQSQMKLTVDEDKTNPLFLYYFFKMPGTIQQIVNRVSSSGVPHINLSVLKAFEVPVPDKDIQDSIVEFIRQYDDLIDNNRRRIALLERAARLLYEEWFVRIHFPGHDLIRKREGRPEQWRRRFISEIVTTQYGYTDSASVEPIGPKFLRGTDINKTSYIDWDSVPYCSDRNLSFEQYALRPNDILVIRMADPGKVAIVEQEIRAVFASYLVRLQILPGAEVHPLYLFYVMDSPAYIGYISGSSEKSTRKSASAPLLTNFEIRIPPSDLQQQFVETVGIWRKQINLLLRQNGLLARARDLLLSRLMSGELEL